MTRSRRAGQPPAQDRHRPLYARLLGLRNLAPSGFLCFMFLEGTIALSILLALAELVSWWGVLVLPMTVAVMVKLNDVIAGAVTPAAVPTPRVVSSAAAGWASNVPGTGRDPFAANTRHVGLGEVTRSPGSMPRTDVSRGPVSAPALRSPVASPPQAGWPPRADQDLSLGRAQAVGRPRHEIHGWTSTGATTAVDANGPAPWAEELDARLQRERHSAARRYE
jgi:hypothetical protein